MYYGYKISDFTANLARQAEADCKEIFTKERGLIIQTSFFLCFWFQTHLLCFLKHVLESSIVFVGNDSV